MLEESMGMRLKTFRLSKKGRQQDMALALGCNISTYNRYEKIGITTTKELEPLYNMGCNINWLVTGKESMAVTKNYNNPVEIVCEKQADVLREQADVINKQADVINKHVDIVKIMAENVRKTRTNLSTLSITTNNNKD